MPSKYINKFVKWVAIFGAVALLVVVYALFNPAETSWFPKCPFRQLTGFDCPGCGSQRAVHHLLHLDIPAAFAENMLLVIAIPYLIVGFTFDMIPTTNGNALKWRKRLFGTTAIFIILAIIILFWVLRNVPYLSNYL